ncbi:metallophosphoesterase [Spirochaetota bacterium]
MDFIIFLSATLAIHLGANFYIFIRGWQSIPKGNIFRKFYLVLFILLFLSYTAARIIEKYLICTLSEILFWIGSFWFAFMLYLFLFILLIDILRLLNRFIHFFPTFISDNYTRTKKITAIAVFTLSCLIIIGGFINAINPRMKKVDILIDKKAGNLRSLNIAMASDIHLGTIIRNSRFNCLVKKINSLNADIVLLVGDTVDEDLAPVIKLNLGKTLRSIKSKYGTFAVTGNHEYFGGVEESTKYFQKHNIRVLRDEIIKINKSLYLVGREDVSKKSRTGKDRKSLKEILKGIDKKLPVIIMDHQPVKNGNNNLNNNFDLQLSGHTHHGQMWPVNFFTEALFKISWGYKKIGKTHYYVSSGFGTWGPPVRIGNSPEIVNIRINFKK